MPKKQSIDYATLKKGGFMRQKQKNRFSLRLAVVGGTVTAKQLAAVIKTAKTYGRGYVHLTSRQSIEIPFIQAKDIPKVKETLAKGGIHPSVGGPRVRTVTACQGNEVCPNGCINSQAIARELSERYFGRDLPHKFKIGVTGCPNNCLKAEENDVGVKGGLRVRWRQDACIRCGACVKACRRGALTQKDGSIFRDEDSCNFCGRCASTCPVDAWDSTPGYIVSFAGTFGNRIAQGEPVIPFIEDHDTLIRVCDAALAFFTAHAKPGERFRATLDRVGRVKLETAIKKAAHGRRTRGDCVRGSRNL